MKTNSCPCGSGKTLTHCCGPLLAGEVNAATAEALMRSRYSAFTRQDAAYLLRTWHEQTRPAMLDLNEAPPPKWIGLNVIAAQVIDENHAEVEFVARYKLGGRAHRLHETSRFVREQGLWYYVDGLIDGQPISTSGSAADH